MGGSTLSEFDQALADAEEEQRQDQAAAAVVPITEPPPASKNKGGRPRKNQQVAAAVEAVVGKNKVDDAITQVVSEDAAEKFVTYVRAYLKVCAVRRADRTLFDDRCVACERRGVHSRDRFRCDCPCHEIRKLLPPA